MHGGMNLLLCYKAFLRKCTFCTCFSTVLYVECSITVRGFVLTTSMLSFFIFCLYNVHVPYKFGTPSVERLITNFPEYFEIR